MAWEPWPVLHLVATILNPHAHLLVLDGVYRSDGHRAVFTKTRAPTQSEIAEVTRRVQARVLRELERRGMLRDPNDARNDVEDEPMIGCAQLSLRLGKLGRVDEHGSVQPDDMDLDARFARRGNMLNERVEAVEVPARKGGDGHHGRTVEHLGGTIRGEEDLPVAVEEIELEKVVGKSIVEDGVLGVGPLAVHHAPRAELVAQGILVQGGPGLEQGKVLLPRSTAQVVPSTLKKELPGWTGRSMVEQWPEEGTSAGSDVEQRFGGQRVQDAEHLSHAGQQPGALEAVQAEMGEAGSTFASGRRHRGCGERTTGPVAPCQLTLPGQGPNDLHMTARPRDTTEEAYELQARLHRSMAPEQRSELALRMSDDIRRIAAEGIRLRHPEYSDRDVRRALVAVLYGVQAAKLVWPDEPVPTP